MAGKKKNVSNDTVSKNTVKTNVRKRTKIDRNIEVLFMNNTNGNFFYRCPKTQNVYDMQEYGDVDYITVDELLTMRNSHRKILNDLWILLIDVNSDEVELEDVLRFLGIDKLYNDIVKPDKIDGFILRTGDKKFKDILERMNKIIAKKVVERAIVLFKEGKFNSISKANILKEFTGNEHLFE